MMPKDKVQSSMFKDHCSMFKGQSLKKKNAETLNELRRY